jgi:hypothetical protein
MEAKASQFSKAMQVRKCERKGDMRERGSVNRMTK